MHRNQIISVCRTRAPPLFASFATFAAKSFLVESIQMRPDIPDSCHSKPEFAESRASKVFSKRMDVVKFTRQLIDIESTTGHEGPVGEFLAQELRRLGYHVQVMVAERDRANLFATSPQQPHPAVVFSTHMDTVPPFIPSSVDEHRLF